MAAKKKARKKAKKKAVRKPKNSAPQTAPESSSSSSNQVFGADAGKRKAISALVNKINTKAKKRVVSFADEATNTFWLRRPSGIMQLDIDTGGGLPAGGLTTFGGPDNSGKSLLLYMYFAMNQRLYGRKSAIAYATTEGNLDFWWARRVGWIIPIPNDIIDVEQDNRKLRGVPLLTKDEIKSLQTEIGTNVIVDGVNAEQILDNVLAFIRSNEFQIVSIDSFDSLMPDQLAQKETVGEAGQQGSKATLLSRFIYHYQPIARGLEGTNFTTTIGTTQVRANRKKSEAASYIAKYMSEYTESVAYAVRHGRLINIFLDRGEKVAKGKGKEKTRTAKYIRWLIEKGKAGTHDGITGEVRFDYADLINTQSSVLIAGMRYGVIKEHEGVIIVQQENGEELIRFEHGAEEFVDELYDNFELELAVRREILAATGKSCAYR